VIPTNHFNCSRGRDFELEREIAARTCGMGSGKADVVAQMRALRDKGAPWVTDSGHLERPGHQISGWEMAYQQREAHTDRLSRAGE
jgi:hypothetical protein